MDSEACVLVDFMDSVFYGPGWHGPELYTTLRSLSVEQVLQPAGPDGYSAWQLTLHCAYWKHITLQRLGGGSEPFERMPDDFPAIPHPADQAAWESDLQLLVDKHEGIKAIVKRLPNGELGQRSADEKFSKESLLLSIAAHDAYHIGHIRNMGIHGLR